MINLKIQPRWFDIIRNSNFAFLVGRDFLSNREHNMLSSTILRFRLLIQYVGGTYWIWNHLKFQFSDKLSQLTSQIIHNYLHPKCIVATFETMQGSLLSYFLSQLSRYRNIDINKDNVIRQQQTVCVLMLNWKGGCFTLSNISRISEIVNSGKICPAVSKPMSTWLNVETALYSSVQFGYVEVTGVDN